MLIAIGLLLLVFAAFVYAWERPEILARIGSYFVDEAETIEEVKQELGDSTRSEKEEALPLVEDEIPPSTEEQLLSIRPGHFVELALDNGEVREMQVNGRITYKELRQYGGGFDPSGTTWPGLSLFGDWMLTRINGTWYLFDSLTRLTADEARAFQPVAEAFGNDSQKRGSTSTDWQGSTWKLFDIGITDIDASGRTHLAPGDRIRFLLADKPDGRVFYLEHVRKGPGYAWTGRRVDINNLVTKIT